MKYKRQKNKYISNCTEARKKRRNTALQKRSAAIAVLLVISFALTRIGILQNPSELGGAFPKGIENIIQGEGGGFIKSLGDSISDFCFRYLRGSKNADKASVRAKDNDSDAETFADSPASLDGAEISASKDSPDAKSSAEPPMAEFMPIMPCMGEISSDFGARVHPVSGEESFHNGIDIAGDEGSEIYACESGKVIFAGFNEFSGNHIKIEHTDGYISSYSHLSRIDTEVGEEVQRGAFIGLTGSTGIATGPHLHFEITKNGEVQSPLSLIKR